MIIFHDTYYIPSFHDFLNLIKLLVKIVIKKLFWIINFKNLKFNQIIKKIQFLR